MQANKGKKKNVWGQRITCLSFSAEFLTAFWRYSFERLSAIGVAGKVLLIKSCGGLFKKNRILSLIFLQTNSQLVDQLFGYSFVERLGLRFYFLLNSPPQDFIKRTLFFSQCAIEAML